MSRYRIIEGDVRERLLDLDDGSVQTCITSPPYWGLRDYGTAEWQGGSAECDHSTQSKVSRASSGLVGSTQTQGGAIRGGDCKQCGAKRVDSQIGLEETPEEYTEHLVEVFREVRRVLRDDGTLWLNLGDSYMGGGGGNYGSGISTASDHGQHLTNVRNRRNFIENTGLKPKDLVGIPWRVALALQADGWYLRSDIIWHKPNPMPESVRDRPTKAHEYLFLLSKSPRYYYDADAIRESSTTEAGTAGTWDGNRDFGLPNGQTRFAKPNLGGSIDGRRNKRSVWTVTTKPFKGAHFAVFPPDLIEPCVLAGSAEGDTVLDPFTGSGTTGIMALRHGRDFVGTELNPEYAQMARDRIQSDAPLLNEAAA